MWGGQVRVERHAIVTAMDAALSGFEGVKATFFRSNRYSAG
jgi:hypothetical protein